MRLDFLINNKYVVIVFSFIFSSTSMANIKAQIFLVSHMGTMVATRNKHACSCLMEIFLLLKKIKATVGGAIFAEFA